MARVRAALVAGTLMAALLSGCGAARETAGTAAKADDRVPPASVPRERGRAITALLGSVDRAWNAGNAKAFASNWTNDGVVISPQGRRTEGRDDIRKEQASAFAGAMKGTTHKLAATEIQWSSSDVAVVDGDAVISGLKGDDGTTYPPLSARFTCVCVNQHGRWLVSHMVSYTFMNS
ncbi:SgcJ/EcaC family oxidoreductase [Actinoallomurus sp. NBC_01490]|uniref:SgcJ/EcaC family oxidoreductase n=1 Tax=Actinoallomurus sp. NBC_01490 TaxID=2903557 RepID=UPI002E310692|nr:SgcJ/EcaC family oxidoreductase [Actinoallomurus sp. NBC_01490]